MLNFTITNNEINSIKCTPNPHKHICCSAASFALTVSYFNQLKLRNLFSGLSTSAIATYYF